MERLEKDPLHYIILKLPSWKMNEERLKTIMPPITWKVLFGTIKISPEKRSGLIYDTEKCTLFAGPGSSEFRLSFISLPFSHALSLDISSAMPPYSSKSTILPWTQQQRNKNTIPDNNACILFTEHFVVLHFLFSHDKIKLDVAEVIRQYHNVISASERHLIKN